MKKLLSTTAILLTLTAPALANETTDLRQEIELLKQQLSMMEQKLNAQENQIKANTQKATTAEENIVEVARKMETTPPASNENIKVSVSPLKIETADGHNSIQAFGRIQIDAAAFDDDVADHPDGAKFRRARLGVKGKVAKDWGYKMEWDFANDAVNAKDVYISYDGFKNTSIKVGHTKPRFGMEELTSANHLQLIERSSSGSAFGTGEKLGINLDGYWNHGSFAIGAFNDDAGTNSTDDEAISLDGRVTFVPMKNDVGLVHIGTAASLRKPDSATDSLRFRSRVDNNLQNLRAVDANINNVDQALLNTVELAGQYGPLGVQGEYYRADVSRNNGSADAEFDGWYAQASYFLSGDHRTYDTKKGLFGRPKVNNPVTEGGIGAWEISARYSNIDLNDTSAGITGGEMDTTSFGLNWYPTKQTKLMLNYIMADTDNNAVTPNDDPNILLLRAQIDF